MPWLSRPGARTLPFLRGACKGVPAGEAQARRRTMSGNAGILLSLLVAIIGLVIYALAAGKMVEIGRLMFGCGLLAFLLHADEVIRLFKG
jgi:hypothetical protein